METSGPTALTLVAAEQLVLRDVYVLQQSSSGRPAALVELIAAGQGARFALDHCVFDAPLDNASALRVASLDQAWCAELSLAHTETSGPGLVLETVGRTKLAACAFDEDASPGLSAAVRRVRALDPRLAHLEDPAED